MAYTISTPELGYQPIAQAAATGVVSYPLGTIVTAYDPTYGGGQFMYLLGVASNIVGAVVTYNPLTGLTTLVPNTANLAAPLAVSMNANTSITTGSWYQVQGAAVVKKTAVKVGAASKIYISATAGRVMPTSASGKQVLNALGALPTGTLTVLSATSTIVVQINFPFAQGQIT